MLITFTDADETQRWLEMGWTGFRKAALNYRRWLRGYLVGNWRWKIMVIFLRYGVN
jgi:hypothetical protein